MSLLRGFASSEAQEQVLNSTSSTYNTTTTGGDRDSRLAENIRKISDILRIPYTPFNQELGLEGQVRLLDEESKRSLGVFSIEQAIARAHTLQKQVVLQNGKVSPPICKLVSLKKDLYSKFIHAKVLGEEASEGDGRSKRKSKPKVISLRAKMGIHDVRNKVRQAKELADKNESVRVVMSFRKEEETQAKNLFSAFCEDARKIMDEITKTIEEPVAAKKKDEDELSDLEDEEAEEEYDPNETVVLRAEFKKKSVTVEGKDATPGVFTFGNNVSLTEEKIEQLITEYFEKKRDEPKKSSKIYQKLGLSSSQ